MAFFNPLVIHYATLPVARPESVEPPQQAEPPPKAPPTKPGDISLANIVKLIPGDVVAIYLAVRTTMPADSIVFGVPWPLLLAVACLFVCILLRILATRSSPTGINWWLVIVTAVAFFIWAHALYPTRPGPIIPDFYGTVAGVFAMLFGAVAPKLVPALPDS